MYNKNQYRKFNEKKVLHKVKKQWVTISLALLMMLGGGAITSHVTHASAPINAPVVQPTPTKNIQNNATNLHKTLLTNAVNNNNNNNAVKHLTGKNVPISNESSSSASSANVNKSSASNNLMSFTSADFNWGGTPSDSSDIEEDKRFNNSSLTSLANKAVSYGNIFNSVSNSVSDALSDIGNSFSDSIQSIDDKLSDSVISSTQAKSLSQSASVSASSAKTSEQNILASAKSEFTNDNSARNNVYGSLNKSLASSKYSNYLSLVNDRHVNPTFKDSAVISPGTNYSSSEQQYIQNIQSQLNDLNKQSDQLDNLISKDGISDNGNSSLIMNHPDAMQAHRQLEINWINFYRRMYNLPLVQESSRLDNVAQQYAERGVDPDCLTEGFTTPQSDIKGFYTDADNADQNGIAGHRTGILNYETDVGIGANNGENNINDDTLLGGDYAGMYIGLKDYDYLKPYRNGEIGMNYAISYPKPGLFPYSDAKDAQQWSLWVPTLHGYTSDANTISNRYDSINMDPAMASDLSYFGNDTKIAVHDDTINQNVNVSNIIEASDYGDADYLCYVVDNNAIQLNHTYTITVSNIHNWQLHTFTYTTKLYDPNMNFNSASSQSNSNTNSSASSAQSTQAGSANSSASSQTSQSVAPSSINSNTSSEISSEASQSDNQNSSTSQNNSSNVTPSSEQTSSNSVTPIMPSFNIPSSASITPSSSSASVVMPAQNNTTSMSNNNNLSPVQSVEPQTNANSNVQVNNSTSPAVNKHHNDHVSKQSSMYLSNADFNKRNRSVITVKGIHAYKRTRKGHYVFVKYIRPNTKLAVKRVVKFGKATNLQLTNGWLVTTNKHFVTLPTNHRAKRGYSHYLTNYNFRGLSKRNRSVITNRYVKACRYVRTYKRTRRGRYTRKGRYVFVKYIKPNTKLAVKQVVKFDKVTELRLTNGLFVTSNKRFVKVNRVTKHAKVSRYTQALRKSNYILRHGRRYATRYAYRIAKKFNEVNNSEKTSYRKFVRKHTNRNRKAYYKAQTNLNNLVNALLK